MDETISKRKYKYWVEYSPSANAVCCKCNATIAYFDLRFSTKRVRNIKIWHHFECFFSKFIPSSTVEIENVDSIRFEDFQRIEHRMKNIVYSDIFNVYYAMDALQVCCVCDNSIGEGELHVFTIIEEFKNKDDCVKCSYHLECFNRSRRELNFYGTVEMLAGFSWLDESDKALLKMKVANVIQPPHNDEEMTEIENEEINERLKEQSDLFFGIYDKLNNIDAVDRENLMSCNAQLEPKSKIDKMELLTDCMTFGALKKCPNCGNGQLVYKSGVYVCCGIFSKKRDCLFECQIPDRNPFLIPDDLKQKYIFLSEYVYTQRTRLTRDSLRSDYLQRKQESEAEAFRNMELETDNSSTSASCRSIASQTTDTAIVEEVTLRLPLAGKYICCATLDSSAETELKEAVESLGGKLVKDVFESVLFLVINEFEQSKDSTIIIDAKKFEVPIVSETIIEVLKSVVAGDFSTFLLNIVKCHTISSRLMDETNGVVAKKARYDKEVAVISDFGNTNKEKQILKIDLVDSRFEFSEFTHIYKSDELYSVVLNNFDLGSQKYTYYTMQLLETEECNYYWVFRSWGRIGTNLGDSAAKDFGSKELAIQYFEYIYYKKTGNSWKLRKHSNRVSGKFWDFHIHYNRNN